jgi:pimeloyl-ACP methyl ester carboxylesterase
MASVASSRTSSFVAEPRPAVLHARVWGSGASTLVLLHGLGGSNRYFGAAFDALGQQARLVVPDLLGFGRSPRPERGEYDLDAHAQAVLGALDTLEAGTPLWLGGHSLGALVALRLARRRPDRVRGVVAFAPPLYRSGEDARQRIRALGFWIRWFGMDTTSARLACLGVCRCRVLGSRVIRWLRPELPLEIASDATAHSWTSYVGSFRNLVQDGTAGDLGTIGVPVQLIAGCEDPVLDLAFLRELADAHEHVTLELWPGGHDLPLVAAQRCASALGQSLAAAKGLCLEYGRASRL